MIIMLRYGVVNLHDHIFYFFFKIFISKIRTTFDVGPEGFFFVVGFCFCFFFYFTSMFT